MLQNKVVGILNLLVDRTGKFLAGDENIPDGPLEYRALDGGIRELSRVAVQEQIPIGGVVSSVTLHQQFPRKQLVFANLLNLLPCRICLGQLEGVLAHLFTEGRNLFLRNSLFPLHLVKGAVCPFHDKLLHTVALRMAGRTSYTDIGAFHDALAFDIVGALHTGDDLYNDDCLPVNFLHRDVRGDLGFTAIENGVGDCVHLLKDFLFGKAGDSPCAILHTEDQLAALAVGKGNHGLHVFLAFGRDLALELDILRFTGENLFCGHLDHLLDTTLILSFLIYCSSVDSVLSMYCFKFVFLSICHAVQPFVLLPITNCAAVEGLVNLQSCNVTPSSFT